MVDTGDGRVQGSGVPTIRDLIRDALDGGSSVRKLADDSNGLVKFQTFQELSNAAPSQFPKDIKTVRGMASALRVPESTIVLAYAKSLGIDVSVESGIAARMPKGADGLGIEMQNALVSIVRAAVKMNGVDHADQPEPANDPPTQPDASPESDEGEEVKHYYLLRYESSNPDVITQTPGVDARDDGEALHVLYRSLRLAGVEIEPGSDATVTITQHNGITSLIALVRSDTSPTREEYVMARLRERAAQVTDPAIGSGFPQKARHDHSAKIIRPDHWNEAPPPPSAAEADAASEGFKQSDTDGAVGALSHYVALAREIFQDLADIDPSLDMRDQASSLERLIEPGANLVAHSAYISSIGAMLDRARERLIEFAVKQPSAKKQAAAMIERLEAHANLAPVDG